MRRLGPPPLVCLITPGQANPENYVSESGKVLDAVRSAVDDGVSMIQIREKQLPARLLFELAFDSVEITRGSSTRLIVNDRVDIAVAAGADGVHLPESSFRPGLVRSAFGDQLIIGKSVHSIDSARAAAEDRPDYIFFGPVFETPGKGPAVGLELLTRVRDSVPDIPLIALGGIDEHNWRQAIDAGAAGIAAIRSLNDPDVRRRMIGGLR